MTRWTQRLHKDEQGTAQVEEVLLLSLVALLFAGAAAALGPRLVAHHEMVMQVLSLPFP